jgi:hypothetical protein
MRRRVLPVLFVVPALALSACGGGSDSDDVKPLATPSATASSTTAPSSPSPTTPSLPTTTPEAAKLATSVLGSNAAKTAEEKAVVDAYMTYYDAVSKTYSRLEPAPGLDAGRGKALTKVLDYLDELKTKNHRSVGWSRDNILDVKIVGDSAALRDCAENFTFEVDQNDKPVEDVTPFYLILGQLKKVDGRWLVTSTTAQGSDSDCRS